MLEAEDKVMIDSPCPGAFKPVAMTTGDSPISISLICLDSNYSHRLHIFPKGPQLHLFQNIMDPLSEPELSLLSGIPLFPIVVMLRVHFSWRLSRLYLMALG